jgi:hypothetical protein
MIPQFYIHLKEFPLTQTGKINIKKLPEPKFINNNEIIPPNTKTEKKIFSFCTEILGYDNFGVTNTLISIGFTSLNIIKLLNNILKEYKVEFKITDLINNVDISTLSKKIEESLQISYTKQKPREYYPLTSQQFGVYYDSKIDKDKIIYNQPAIVTFKKLINFQMFKKALEDTIKVHYYINTEFIDVDGVIYQKPSNKTLDIPIFNRLPTDDDKKKFVKPFNLMNQLLYRIELYHDNNESFMLFDFHHILMDGESINLFFNTLLKIYMGNIIKPEEFTIYDLSLDEEEYLNSKEYQESNEFFKNEISSYDGDLSLIPDKHENHNKEKNQEIVIKKELINDLSKKLNVTPNILFLSAVSMSINTFTYNNSNILISTLFNQRDTKYYMSVGMMVKTLPIHLHIDYNDTAESFIEKVNNHYWEVIKHYKYPLLDIVYDNALKPEILYVYQDDLSIDENNEYFLIESLIADNIAKYKISIEVQRKNKVYIINIKYNDGLYTKRLINSFLDSIKSNLFMFEDALSLTSNLSRDDNEN